MLPCVNICWSYVLHGKPIFFPAKRWCNQGPLHSLLTIFSCLAQGPFLGSSPLWYLVLLWYLFPFWDCLRWHLIIAQIPLLLSPFLGCFWLKRKCRKPPTTLIRMELAQTPMPHFFIFSVHITDDSVSIHCQSSGNHPTTFPLGQRPCCNLCNPPSFTPAPLAPCLLSRRCCCFSLAPLVWGKAGVEADSPTSLSDLCLVHTCRN